MARAHSTYSNGVAIKPPTVCIDCNRHLIMPESGEQNYMYTDDFKAAVFTSDMVLAYTGQQKLIACTWCINVGAKDDRK